MIAICVGHSRRGDRGAVSCGNVSEWEYNRNVGDLVVADLAAAGIAAKMYAVYPRSSYAGAINWLAAQLRADGAEAAVELHFNSAHPAAHGFEYLHWATSPRGRALAEALHAAHAAAMPQQKDRGVKGLRPGDRGGHFLRTTHCPAVIAEPFFGSSPQEWAMWGDAQERLAQIYAAGVRAWL